MSKQLRKEIYKTAFELSEQFPEKPSLEAGLDEEIAYTKELLRILEEGIESCGNKKIQKLSREMKELLEDERLKEIRSKEDKDARFGHKTATSTFYGYKNHLAMTEERLIAGLSVTDGGAPDGQELPKLIEKAKENGIKVTEVIGDMAYVSDDNLEVCGKEITLIASGQYSSSCQQQTETLRKVSALTKMRGCCSVLPESFPRVWKKEQPKTGTLI